MKYLNPLDFLTTLHGGPVDLRDNSALSLLRKKSLAELELSDDKMLRVNGQLLSKNDLLLFFDRLQSSQELQYHEQIAADPELLYFLQTGEIKGRIADHPLYRDREFLSFIAPYYEPLFTTGVVNSLKTQDVATLQHLFGGPLLLDGPHITTSYRHVLRYLKVLDNELKAAIEVFHNGGGYAWKRFARFANAALITQLNILPPEFEKWRSDYGISLINLALAIYRVEFRRGHQVLKLVEQLHTTDFVQERLQVRKKELRAYRIKNRPLVDLLGSLTDRIRPDGLTERVAGVLMLGVIIGIVVAINFRWLTHYTPSPGPGVPRKETDFFVGARTGPRMKYLLAQLTHVQGARVVADTSGPVYHTGDDVYGADFMAALKGVAYTPASALAVAIGAPIADTPSDNDDFVDASHRQSLHVFNRLEVPMVVLVQTPDSFYSCFITPKDSTFLPLQTTANRICFYMGQYWTAGDKDLKGYFAASYKNAQTFLQDGMLTFVLDPVYWRRSNRYIPLEIGADENIYTNLLDNNAAGVYLYLGN